VWDAQTGKQVVQPFNTQEFFQNALAFSADGKSLLTSSGDHPLERWDLAAGATNPTSLLVNLGGSGYAHTIAGGRLFIISNDQEKTLTLMDVSTDLPVGKPVSDSSLPGKVFASTPDASLLAIGGCVQPGKTGKDCTQGEIQLVHLPDWTPAGEPLRGHAAAVTSLALSADGKTLISSAEDGTLLVWTLGSPAASLSIDTTHSGLEAGFYFNQLSISNDGRLLAASAFAPSMTVFYETTSGKYLGNTGDLPGWCSWNTTTFDPDGRLFTSGDCGGGFYLVTGVSTGQPVTRTIKDSGDAVMAFSPDGKTFASAGTSISLWTVEGEVLTKGKTLSGCERKIHGMAFSPDGKTLGVLYDDFTVELWDPISGTLLARPYFGALYNPIAPAFNRNATLMAGGICVKRDKGNSCLQSEIHFWDTATGKESGQPILMAATARIDALAFSPDGRWLASADCLTDLTGLNATNLCTQEEVRLWDVTGRKSFGSVLTGLIYDRVNLAFSPHGNLLAGGDSKQVVLWETASGKQHTAPTPLLNGSGLAFRPDGSLLLVGTGNGIILIDPESGRIIGQSTQANADQIAFNASGTMLFSRTAAWQFDPSVWRARLCSQAGRDLTQTEWADYLPGLAYQETCVP
jgi:WD40 repeat protein